MKQAIVKRSKHSMKFFTPELFVQFNSNDEVEADRADAQWEKALLQYQTQLKKKRSKMPTPVWQLSRLNLHDAEVVGFETESEKGNPLAFMTLMKDDQIISLVYVLTSSVVRSAVISHWPFTKAHRHWLYDEVDVMDRQFEHRILLSDGSTLKIPFQSVVMNRTALRSTSRRKVLTSA